MKNKIIEKLKQNYELEKRDMQELTHIKKGLYCFDCQAYTIKGIGNLFFIDMKAMFGLMKMNTTVITPYYKDLSFCNLDLIKVLSNSTGMFEMYKSSIKDTDLSGFEEIKNKYEYLNNYETSPRWYDEFKLDSSIAKKGKNIDKDIDQMMSDCLDEYLKLLNKVEDCDPELKKKEVKKYVDRLLSEGGAAIDSMNKIIGTASTEKLVREFMYNVD